MILYGYVTALYTRRQDDRSIDATFTYPGVPTTLGEEARVQYNKDERCMYFAK